MQMDGNIGGDKSVNSSSSKSLRRIPQNDLLKDLPDAIHLTREEFDDGSAFGKI